MLSSGCRKAIKYAFSIIVLLAICFRRIQSQNTTSKKNIRTKSITSDKTEISFIACWIPVLAQRYFKIEKSCNKLTRCYYATGSTIYRIRTTIRRRTIPDYPTSLQNCIGLTVIANITPYRVITHWYCLDRFKWYRRIRGQITKKRVLLIKKDSFDSSKRTSKLRRIFYSKYISVTPIDQSQYHKFVLCDCVTCGLSEFSIESANAMQDKVRDFVISQIISYFHPHHHFHESIIDANKSMLLKHRVNLKTENNSVLANYISRFAHYIETSISDIYTDCQLLDTPRWKRRFIEWFYFTSEQERSFYETCHNLLGIHVFVGSLINSPQNTHWKLSLVTNTEECRTRYDEAMIIENAKLGVSALINKIRYRHDRRDYKVATMLGILGFFVSIFSFVLALFSLSNDNQPSQSDKTLEYNITNNQIYDTCQTSQDSLSSYSLPDIYNVYRYKCLYPDTIFYDRNPVFYPWNKRFSIQSIHKNLEKSRCFE